VVRHIFQACLVWIYTQRNITSIIFTWVHYTNTEKSWLCIGYFEATREYVIYSPRRAAPRWINTYPRGASK
jgi:hypothetical protein